MLAVLVFHLDPALLPGGFAGVDVFFVISGYLISTITLREAARGEFSIKHFYARRIRRLLPALLVVVPTVLAAGALTLSSPELTALGRHVVAAVTYASNFVLWSESGYFDSASEFKPLLHLWSLAVEEQYYVIWPLLLLIFAKAPRRLRRVVLTLGVASFLGNLAVTSLDRTAAFYASPVRFWEILIGALPALIPRLRLTKRRRAGATLFGLTLIAVSYFMFNGHQRYPGSRALVPTLGALLVILGENESAIARWVLAHPVVTYLGRISYPLYLWHWPLIVFTHLLNPPVAGSLGKEAVIVGLTLLLASLTHHAVERPLGRRKALVRPLLTAWVALGLIGAVVIFARGWPRRYPAFDEAMAVNKPKADAEQFHASCPAEYAALKPRPTFCRRTGRSQSVTAIFGDSHAFHLLSGLERADPDHAYFAVGSNNCPPLFYVTTTDCAARVSGVLNQIVTDPRIGTVIVGFFGNYANQKSFNPRRAAKRDGPPFYDFGDARGATAQAAALREGLGQVVDKLIRAKKRVIFVIDIPELPVYAQECVRRPYAWGNPASCAQGRRDVEERRAPVVAMAESLRASYPELIIFDPIDVLCDRSRCEAIREGRMLYMDDHHLTDLGSERVAQALLETLTFASPPGNPRVPRANTSRGNAR